MGDARMDGLVLAGGRGLRMRQPPAGAAEAVAGIDAHDNSGAQDRRSPPVEHAQTHHHKGLMHLAGRPLIDYVVCGLKPVVDTLYISTTLHPDVYRAWGVCVNDALDSAGHIPFSGPLAGVLAGLRRTRADWLAVAPCDSPFLPSRWAAHLLQAARRASAAGAVASYQGRRQPVCMVVRADTADSLAQFLAQGGRKVAAWQAQVGFTELGFDRCHPHAFMNVNTPVELAEAEALTRAASERFQA